MDADRFQEGRLETVIGEYLGARIERDDLIAYVNTEHYPRWESHHDYQTYHPIAEIRSFEPPARRIWGRCECGAYLYLGRLVRERRMSQREYELAVNGYHPLEKMYGRKR